MRAVAPIILVFCLPPSGRSCHGVGGFHADQTANQGLSATFNVAATTTTPPLSYQLVACQRHRDQVIPNRVLWSPESGRPHRCPLATDACEEFSCLSGDCCRT